MRDLEVKGCLKCSRLCSFIFQRFVNFLLPLLLSGCVGGLCECTCVYIYMPPLLVAIQRENISFKCDFLTEFHMPSSILCQQICVPLKQRSLKINNRINKG